VPRDGASALAVRASVLGSSSQGSGGMLVEECVFRLRGLDSLADGIAQTTRLLRGAQDSALGLNRSTAG
jgi:hypothetical protein